MMKNKKGFTLIELLAVIVVLAIVTVIATQSILPFMANAGRDAFASEANVAIDAASDAISLISIGSASTSNYVAGTETDNKGTSTTTDDVTYNTYCFTLENLKNLGLFQKDDSNYQGTVTVKVPVGGNLYTYSAAITNGEYYVDSPSGTIKTETLSASVPNGVGKYDDLTGTAKTTFDNKLSC